jgi:hypothetical protein
MNSFFVIGGQGAAFNTAPENSIQNYRTAQVTLAGADFARQLVLMTRRRAILLCCRNATAKAMNRNIADF